MKPHHKYSPNWVIEYKNQIIKNKWIKKSASQKEKLSSKKIKNKKIDMDSLHFIPNNILTRIFKELTKYKNGY